MFSDHASINYKICLSNNKYLKIKLVVDFFCSMIEKEINLFVIWESCYGFQIIDEIKERVEKNELELGKFTKFFSFIGYLGKGHAIIPIDQFKITKIDPKPMQGLIS